MQNWLTIELVFGALVVASFTFVGLLAFWAATNSRLWWLRSTFVLVLLLALEEIPAHELWALFSLQACVIILGARLWRWFVSRVGDETARSSRRFPFQFSLRTLLVTPVLLALVVAVAIQIPKSVSPEALRLVPTVAGDGACGACAVLLGVWIIASQRKWIAWPVAFGLIAALACLPAWFDWLFVSVTLWSHWPPYPPISWRNPASPALAWFVILPAVTIATWLMIRLWMLGWGSKAESDVGSMSRTRLAYRAMFILLTLPVAFPPVAVTWRLLHPPAMPILPVPQPNGLDTVLNAGRTFKPSDVLDHAIPCSTEKLAGEVARYSDVYNLLRQGLSHDIQLRDWTKRPTTDETDLGAYGRRLAMVRAASFALLCEARLAREQERYDDAGGIAIECLQLARAVGRNGLLEDLSYSLEMEYDADRLLYEVLPHLSSDQCRKTLAALAEIDAHREPLENVWHRQRIWFQNSGDWFWQLVMLLPAMPSDNSEQQRVAAILKKDLTTRLLVLETALRIYCLEQGAPPDQLKQLIPELLSSIPRDPFDPQRGPLRSIHTDDDLLVYSVGPDGRDDGGRLPNSYPFCSFSGLCCLIDSQIAGDVALDVFFARKTSKRDSTAASTPATE